MKDEDREAVDSCLERLELLGSRQQPRPLANPLLWGNYDVAYTSTGRAPSQRGQRKSHHTTPHHTMCKPHHTAPHHATPSSFSSLPPACVLRPPPPSPLNAP